MQHLPAGKKQTYHSVCACIERNTPQEILIMSKKRAREPVNIDTELVEIFEDLSNPSEELRLKAAQLLISKVKTEKLDVRKILKRLLRGLCSGRKAARPGFSVALTEFLRQNVLVGGGGDTLDTDLSPHEVVTFLREQTKIGGNVGSQVNKQAFEYS